MPDGTGLIARFHFADACAALWLDRELVEVEELFLDDAARDIRSPSHQLTIARDVLQTRRCIGSHEPGWALSPKGLRSVQRTRSVKTSRKLAGCAAGDRCSRCLERASGSAAFGVAWSLLAASILRQTGITTGVHLAAINLGLKTIPVDQHRHPDRETRLLAIAHSLIATA